jgi:glycosyltransferase involved in cell wall biosynthesis
MIKPVLSICCITYNHVNYIRDCIEGFILQKTDFPIEILIFDDASTDGTQDIIKEYSSNYSNIIIFLQAENQWKKQKYGLTNYLFPASKGKYIAICEGDDYWTDPFKLQKQVDFLEINSDYNLCYHEVRILSDKGIFSNDFINKTIKNTTSKFDLAVWGNYIHTCTVVVRNNFFFNNYFNNINLFDYLLYMNFINDGKIKKIEEIMSVYRYGQGIWSSSSNNDKNKFMIDNIYNILETTNDDTIKEIMKLRLNSIAFYSLPNFITKIEDSTNRSFDFEINEKITISILFKIIKKKIILKLKKLNLNLILNFKYYYYFY